MKVSKMQAFTLIEMLVVITIIGILATGATLIYTSQLQKTRDTNRIKDIKTLESAVNQCAFDKMFYPANTLTGFSSGVSPYLSTIPADPKNGHVCYGGGGCGYLYRGGNDEKGNALSAYILSTAFESQSKAETDAYEDDGFVTARFEVGNGSNGGGGTWGMNPSSTTILAIPNTSPTIVIPLGGSLGNVLYITGN